MSTTARLLAAHRRDPTDSTLAGALADRLAEVRPGPDPPLICSWEWWVRHGDAVLTEFGVTRVHLTTAPPVPPNRGKSAYQWDYFPGVTFVLDPPATASTG